MTASKKVEFELRLGGDVVVQEAVLRVYRVTAADPERIEKRVVRGREVSLRLPKGKGRVLYAVAEILKIRQGEHEAEVGERRVQLVGVFKRSSKKVVLSERVTVATAYCFSRFLKVEAGGRVILSDRHRAIRLAYGMRKNFVGTRGKVSRVIRSSPNGLETNSWPLFNFLANLVHYGLTSEEVYAAFTGLLESTSLFGALHRLALDPFVDPEAIYGLIGEKAQVFRPSLPELEPPATPVPDQWTLAVKVNDSGAENFMIGGPGYGVFDKNDRIWLTNNARQGTRNSSTFCVVLEPNGSPAPFSPLFGGGLLGGGFGVAADPEGETIYFGNYGWGPMEWNPQKGSVSAFTCGGKILSPPNGWVEGLSRVQGMACDEEGNLWIASWGSQVPMAPAPSRYNFPSENSAVVVYPKGRPKGALVFSFDSPFHLTFDVALDEEGNAYACNAGYRGDEENGIHPVPSSVVKLRIVDGEIRCLARWISKEGNETLRQIAVDPGGDVYVGAVTGDRVIRLSRDLEYRGELKQSIQAPWGLTFDPAGTLWVANFVREMDKEAPAGEKIGPFGVTVIRRGKEETAKLMTLPTGGNEVTLANGLPLYGNPETGSGQEIPLHSYDPLMRLTGTSIDRAGNLWAFNNWKPSAAIDLIRGNPPGDGVVIFVGVAEPQPRPRAKG